MEPSFSPYAIASFAAILIATFAIAVKGRIDASTETEEDLSKQKLNRWLVGLSAGAAANSGFVVTGAVGLGYSYGVHWLLLPFGWFLGDLVFWYLFPHRINELGHRANASSLTDLIAFGLPISKQHPLLLLTSLVVIIGLGGYTMAQWVAGQKFIEGSFGLSGTWALVIFGLAIVGYSAVGRFRGSVYVDTFQAVTRLLGTFIALVSVLYLVLRDTSSFWEKIDSVDASFFSLIGSTSLVSSVAFVVGYAGASIGFGLGQPQVTSRYLAAESPSETRAAKWIYIGYVQLTWALMTVFGIFLRGIMPDISDPEKGLTIFVAATLPSIFVGIIAGDIFGAIASTANSLLVAMAQAVQNLFPEVKGDRIGWLTFVFGLITLLATPLLQGNATVFDLAITSISFIAAGVGPMIAIKSLGWRHNVFSLTAALLLGFTTACIWKFTGVSGTMNESVPGIAVGLIVNFVIMRISDAEQSG
jgi:sodium/proline symporter